MRALTRDQMLWGAHRAIERLEWLDHHVSARSADKATTKRLMRELRELENYLIAATIAFAPPQEPPTHSHTRLKGAPRHPPDGV